LEFVETNQTYNKLLKRHELHALIEFEQAPPTRKEVIQAIASRFNVPENNIVILKMACLFGARKMRVHSHIYDNAEDMRRFEREYILKRNGLVQQ